MTGRPTCQDCGGELTGPRGHCPRCLFKAGVEGESLSLGAGGEVGVTMTLGSPESSGGASTLEALTASIGPVPRVLLRDTDPGTEPSTRTGTAATPTPADHAGRLQLMGEIARGGMGAVLKGRDTDLGRELAVKVLLDRHCDSPDLVRRFVEEAQIAGQLQHPGIVPVYELGTFADHRPYFSMKLVRGRTLAELLQGRSSSARDLPRFLGIFEAVCQTMAYAHARGVIHRDLKPSNVMVGSFGEVQVMDWGLAKVLSRVGAVDENAAAAVDSPAQQEVIATARSGSDNSESLAGSVMGTPSYMAPEQARGEIGQVDERADVFALGSILCEILTGRPAFDGADVLEIHSKSARGETADAWVRLDACGAAALLRALAKDCLATAAADRPADAGVVAGRVRAYLAGVQEQLRRAELARVEERARRRLTMVVSASVVVLTGVLVAGWAWLNHESAARSAVAARALRESVAEARVFHTKALAAPADDLTNWNKALEAGRRAETSLNDGEKDPVAQEQLHSFLENLQSEGRTAAGRADQMRADRQILNRISESHMAFGEHYDRTRLDALFTRAFQDYGIDIKVLEPAEAGRQIAGRAIKHELVGIIDEWIFNQRALGDEPGVGRLMRVAASADPDPWRTNARSALATSSLTSLQQLADSIDLDAVPAISAKQLALGLGKLGDMARAVSLFRTLQRRYPRDYWINVDLANHLLTQGPAALVDVIRFATVAISIQPKSPSSYDPLVSALVSVGRVDDAVSEYHELIKHHPGGSPARNVMGILLAMQGKPDEAIEQWREAIRLDPTSSTPRRNLFDISMQTGRLAEARVYVHELLRLNPNDAMMHYHAALALLATSPDGDEYRKVASAILDRLGETDDRSVAYVVARTASLAPGVTDRSEKLVALATKSVEGEPTNAWAIYVLGLALYRAGQFDAAINRLRESGQADPNWHATALNWPVLAMAHFRLRHADEARHWLAQAEQKNTNLIETWWDRLELELMLREAQILVRDSLMPIDPFAR
jgi:tetratricopeptide (TPR) repeat protein/tRNA A-37 threonylcarbamoyl transferase component Bud32